MTDVESGGHGTMLGGQQSGLFSRENALKDGLTVLSPVIVSESAAL